MTPEMGISVDEAKDGGWISQALRSGSFLEQVQKNVGEHLSVNCCRHGLDFG